MRTSWPCEGCVSLLLFSEIYYDRDTGFIFCEDCWNELTRSGTPRRTGTPKPRPDPLLCEECGAGMKPEELLGSSGWRGTKKEPMYCNRCSVDVSDEYVWLDQSPD